MKNKFCRSRSARLSKGSKLVAIALLGAVAGLAQASDEVIATVTTSPFSNPEF